jgi:hypothetical protein
VILSPVDSFARDVRYLFLTIIVLIALKLTHNLSNLSFFLTNRIGDPARDLDFLINPSPDSTREYSVFLCFCPNIYSACTDRQVYSYASLECIPLLFLCLNFNATLTARIVRRF